MDLEKLFTVLSSIHPLSEDLRVALRKEMIPLSLPKNYMLLEAPKIAEYAYFIDRGFAMSFTFIKGRKQIENFWSPGQIVISGRSFFEQIPSQEFIQLMVQSDVLHISHVSATRLLENFPEANIILRVIMNRYYEQCRERVHDLQHLNAFARYKKLNASFPHIQQLIPQEYIASYLGIAPQSLSRLKKQSGDA